MNKTASDVLNVCLSAHSRGKNHSRSANNKTKNFTIYTHVVSFFLKNYTIDEVIPETKSDITRFAQPSHMTPSKYAEELVKKTY